MTVDEREIERLMGDLSAKAQDRGGSILGVADLEGDALQGEDRPEILKGFSRAISLGLPLSSAVLRTIESSPNRLYLHHYKTVNAALDQMALVLSVSIEEQGWLALPVPASILVAWRPMAGHLSHKRIAALAGAGWMGRNGLLTTAQWGCALRLATVLTTCPLPPSSPSLGSCGDCDVCVRACPAGAMGPGPDEFSLEACFLHLDGVSKRENLGQHICGVCQRACMESRRTARDRGKPGNGCI